MSAPVTSPPTTAAPASVLPKKARLNPARRKAAQANRAQQNTQNKTSTVTTTTPPADTSGKTGKKAPRKKAPRKLSRASTSSSISTLSTSSTNSAPKNAQAIVKYTSQQPPSQSDSSKSLVHAGPALVTGGIVGCVAGAAILMGVSIWYNFSGVEAAILAAKAAKLCVDNLADETIASLKAGTYSAQEALDVLRRTTLAYSTTIPGGAVFVERTFREIDTVRKQRGPEVESIMQAAFDELSIAGKSGKSPSEMQLLVRKHLVKLSTVVAATAQDMVVRHPNLKPLGDGATKYLTGVAPPKTPTVRVNMQVKVR